MRTAWIATVVALLPATACGGASSTAPPEREPTTAPAGPAFDHASAVIETSDGRISIDVELADTEERREFGLMFREALPPDAGMVFLYDAPHTGGYWMKNTLIPLSIAFYDDRGRIVRILDMQPCRADPCPLYDPEVAYSGALEVNQGAFRRWGVETGDRIHVKVAVA